MTRKQQIERAAQLYESLLPGVFIRGAEWADKNPDYDSKLDIVKNMLINDLNRTVVELEKELEVAYTYIEVLEEKK